MATSPLSYIKFSIILHKEGDNKTLVVFADGKAMELFSDGQVLASCCCTQ